MERDEPGEAVAAADRVAVGGAYDPEQGAPFDAGVFALLAAVLVFVAVTNLWLRWRAQGEGFGEALRRRWGRFRPRP
jgi:hypothetical protein